MSNDFVVLARNCVQASNQQQKIKYISQLVEIKRTNSEEYFNGILNIISNFQNETDLLLLSLIMLSNVRSLPCKIAEDLIGFLLPLIGHPDERVRETTIYLLDGYIQFSMQINRNYEPINYIKSIIQNEQFTNAVQSGYELLSNLLRQVIKTWPDKALSLELFSFLIEPLKEDIEIPRAKCILTSLLNVSEYMIDCFCDEEQFAHFLNQLISKLIPIPDLKVISLSVLENSIKYCYSIIEHIIPSLIEIEPPNFDQNESNIAFIQLWTTIYKLEKSEPISFQATFTASSTLIPYLCEIFKSQKSGDMCDLGKWTPSETAYNLLRKISSINKEEAHPALCSLIEECDEESVHIALKSMIILLKTGFEIGEGDVSFILELIGIGIESEFQITNSIAMEAAFHLVFYYPSIPFSAFEGLLNISIVIWQNVDEIYIARAAFSVSRIILKKLDWNEREEYVKSFIEELGNCPPQYYNLFFNAVDGILSDSTNPVEYLRVFLELFESLVSDSHSSSFYESLCNLISDLIVASNNLKLDISEFVEPISVLMKKAVETSRVQSPIATAMDLVLYQTEAFEPFSSDYLIFFCDIISDESYEDVQAAALCGLTTLLSFYDGAADVIPQMEPLLHQFLERNKIFEMPEDYDEEFEICQKEEGFEEVCKLLDAVLERGATISPEFFAYFFNELRITLSSMMADLGENNPRAIISNSCGIVIKASEMTDAVDVNEIAVLLITCISNLWTVCVNDIPSYKALAQFVEERNLVGDEFSDILTILSTYEDPDIVFQNLPQTKPED